MTPGTWMMWSENRVLVLPDRPEDPPHEGYTPVWCPHLNAGRLAPTVVLKPIAAPSWDYVSVLANSPRVVNLVADGWEPFAVTVVPDGMRLHQHDGGTVYYVERLHLRRVTT